MPRQVQEGQYEDFTFVHRGGDLPKFHETDGVRRLAVNKMCAYIDPQTGTTRVYVKHGAKVRAKQWLNAVAHFNLQYPEHAIKWDDDKEKICAGRVVRDSVVYDEIMRHSPTFEEGGLQDGNYYLLPDGGRYYEWVHADYKKPAPSPEFVAKRKREFELLGLPETERLAKKRQINDEERKSKCRMMPREDEENEQEKRETQKELKQARAAEKHKMRMAQMAAREEQHLALKAAQVEQKMALKMARDDREQKREEQKMALKAAREQERKAKVEAREQERKAKVEAQELAKKKKKKVQQAKPLLPVASDYKERYAAFEKRENARMEAEKRAKELNRS